MIFKVQRSFGISKPGCTNKFDKMMEKFTFQSRISESSLSSISDSKPTSPVISPPKLRQKFSFNGMNDSYVALAGSKPLSVIIRRCVTPSNFSNCTADIAESDVQYENKNTISMCRVSSPHLYHSDADECASFLRSEDLRLDSISRRIDGCGAIADGTGVCEIDYGCVSRMETSHSGVTTLKNEDQVSEDAADGFCHVKDSSVISFEMMNDVIDDCSGNLTVDEGNVSCVESEDCNTISKIISRTQDDANVSATILTEDEIYLEPCVINDNRTSGQSESETNIENLFVEGNEISENLTQCASDECTVSSLQLENESFAANEGMNSISVSFEPTTFEEETLQEAYTLGAGSPLSPVLGKSSKVWKVLRVNENEDVSNMTVLSFNNSLAHMDEVSCNLPDTPNHNGLLYEESDCSAENIKSELGDRENISSVNSNVLILPCPYFNDDLNEKITDRRSVFLDEDSKNCNSKIIPEYYSVNTDTSETCRQKQTNLASNSEVPNMMNLFSKKTIAVIGKSNSEESSINYIEDNNEFSNSSKESWLSRRNNVNSQLPAETDNFDYHTVSFSECLSNEMPLDYSLAKNVKEGTTNCKIPQVTGKLVIEENFSVINESCTFNTERSNFVTRTSPERFSCVVNKTSNLHKNLVQSEIVITDSISRVKETEISSQSFSSNACQSEDSSLDNMSKLNKNPSSLSFVNHSDDKASFPVSNMDMENPVFRSDKSRIVSREKPVCALDVACEEQLSVENCNQPLNCAVVLEKYDHSSDQKNINTVQPKGAFTVFEECLSKEKKSDSQQNFHEIIFPADVYMNGSDILKCLDVSSIDIDDMPESPTLASSKKLRKQNFSLSTPKKSHITRESQILNAVSCGINSEIPKQVDKSVSKDVSLSKLSVEVHRENSSCSFFETTSSNTNLLERSPLLFSEDEDDEPCSRNHFTSLKENKSPAEDLCSNSVRSLIVEKHHQKLKQIQELLLGIPPPPSITMPTHTVEDMLRLIKQNEHLMVKKIEGENKAELKFERKKTALKDVLNTNWPHVKDCDYFDIYYNQGAVTEELDRQYQRLQQRFVGRETASSCNPMFSVWNSGKTTVRRQRNVGQSPGSRLSHLARRRQSFSSSSLQPASVAGKLPGTMHRSAIERRLIMVEVKKLEKQKHKTGGISNTSFIQTSENCRREEKAVLNSRLRSSRRALFQSPVDEKKADSQFGFRRSSLPADRQRTSASKTSASLRSSQKKRLSLVENLNVNGKRNRDDTSMQPRKFSRRLNFDEITSSGSSTTTDCSKRLETASQYLNKNTSLHNGLESCKAPSRSVNFLSDVNRKKLLWAVAEALRREDITMNHHLFRKYASSLTNLVRRQLSNMPLTASIQKANRLTSEYMLGIALQHVKAIVQNKK